MTRTFFDFPGKFELSGVDGSCLGKDAPLPDESKLTSADYESVFFFFNLSLDVIVLYHRKRVTWPGGSTF